MTTKNTKNTTKPTLLPGGVTQAQIDKWKSQHGEIKQIVIPLDDLGKNNAHGYVRKPDLDVISAANRFSDTDPLQAGQILFENCFLGGDPEISQNQEAKMSAMTAISQLFKIRKAEIKNV